MFRLIHQRGLFPSENPSAWRQFDALDTETRSLAPYNLRHSLFPTRGKDSGTSDSRVMSGPGLPRVRSVPQTVKLKKTFDGSFFPSSPLAGCYVGLGEMTKTRVLTKTGASPNRGLALARNGGVSLVPFCACPRLSPLTTTKE